jgi:hypothetical protein
MIRTSILARNALCAAVLGFALTGCNTVSMAPTTSFGATLSGASEVPPTTSPGTGRYDAKLDRSSKVLSWTLSYSGLTGPATAAHLHGPALPGSNAGVIVPFGSASSGSTGSATLTDAQIADLTAGKWYANVHTAANPGGEIRGQVMAQ